MEGHRNASGFSVELETWIESFVKRSTHSE